MDRPVDAAVSPRKVRRPLSIAAYQRARLRKIAALCRGSRVLDIGYARMPNPYFQKLHRVGLDLASPMTPSGYEEEIIGDGCDLPASLGARRFDTIVAGELIEHLEQPYEFLRSLPAFLTAEGRVILSTPNPVAWPVAFFEVVRSTRYFYSHDHLYYFSPRWVTRMLERSGFVVRAVVPVGLFLPLPGIVLPCPVGLSYQVIYVATPASD